MLASVGGSKKRVLPHDSEEKAQCKGQSWCGDHLGRALVEHVSLTTALVAVMAQSRTCAARDDRAKREVPRITRLAPGKNVEAVAPESSAEDGRVDGGFVV